MVLLVLLVLRGSSGSSASPWFFWFSMVLVVLLVGFPVLLAPKSPAIGTTCGNPGVRDGMRVKSERMDERDTRN